MVKTPSQIKATASQKKVEKPIFDLNIKTIWQVPEVMKYTMAFT